MQMVMVKTIGRNSLQTENGTNAPFLEVKYSYAKPNKPRVQAYSNGSGSGSGHFNVQWDAVPGATGYKVAILMDMTMNIFLLGM